MNIRINRIALHNFKGVRDAVFQFDGRNARIEGENGAGKSTVFDSFTWLLFGKDHQGQDWTNFDLKPIDPETREPFHGLDHWVEAELTIDGAKRVLRRVVTENWVKPRGETEKVMKGHNQQFFVDGVDTATKNAYDAVIHQWIDEGVFKMLTNPLFFIDDQYTDWKTRRKAILALVGESGRDGLQTQFADLLAEMRGEPMEQFKRRVAAEKKANRQDLATATANIAAFKKTLPKAVDGEGLNFQIEQIIAERDGKISEVQGKISTIDAGIADINSANDAKKAEIDAIWRQIYALRDKMGKYISERQSDAQKRNAERNGRILEARRAVADVQAQLEDVNRRGRKAQEALEDFKREKVEQALSLSEIGEKYKKRREEAFDPKSVGVCPTCGQMLPEDVIEAKAEEFAKERKAALDAMADKAVKLKKEIAELDATVASRQKALEGLKTERAELTAKRDTAEKALADLEETAPEDLDAIEKEARREPEFLKMVTEELDLQSQAKAAAEKSVSTEDLMSDRKAAEAEAALIRKNYEEKVQPLRDQLAVNRERERVLKLIADEEAREKKFADEVARLERLEFRATEYVKAEIDAQEGAINALFRVARWKMFAPTIEGGLTEMCEVTNTEGVPFRSMNDAKKILCGLDVIRVFSERYDCLAPIFIDNAESITKKVFDTEAQVIRLVVSEGAELTMYNE